MDRKGLAAAAMAFVMMLSAGACAQEQQKTTFTGDTAKEPEYQMNLNAISPSAYGDVEGLDLEPGTYISIIGKMEGTSYWDAVKSGVMQAAADLNEKLGYTGSDKIKVTYNGPAKAEDIDEQVNILDEELSRYPDVIGIASIDEAACTVQFDLATENGIPIIALDSGNQYQGIQCTVKTDNQDAARTGAYKLADEMDKKGDVVVLSHDSKSETARERVESLQAEIEANYPDIHVAEIIYCDMLDDIKKEMAEEENQGLKEGERKIEKEIFSDTDAVQYVMEKYPDLRGMFGTNASATALALESIRQAEQAGAEEAEEGGGTDKRETVDKSAEPEAKKSNGESAEPVKEKSDDESAGLGTEADENSDADKGAETDHLSEGSRESFRIALVGFDTEKELLKALESGEVAGLVVQNPFGMGYASVVAAARTVLEAGNEAQVSTSYLWLTKDNMNDESVQKMLYE